MAKAKILIVDDEPDIIELIKYNLEREGFQTITSTSGEAVHNLVVKNKVDLVILDLMLPGIDGLEVCRALKRDDATQAVPVLMLTAKGDDSDVISGLELGADDYMVKPFSPKVLIARIRAILRRNYIGESKASVDVVSLHGIYIDATRHEVKLDDKAVTLSVSEFKILHFLAQNPGWVFSRNQIISGIKGDDYPVTERSIDVQILGLRKKLGEKGVLVETVRGIGYRLKE